MKRVTGLLTGVFALLFAGLMITCIVSIAIWPGEAKLLGPLLCPDGQPDAFVVSDTTNPRPGETVTNFTLYCVGERGEATDMGFARPFIMLTIGHAVLVFVLIALFALPAALRGEGFVARRREARARRRRLEGDVDQDDPPSSTSGPFVGSTPGPFVD